MGEALRSDNGEGSGIEGEYTRPDAAGAFKIYDSEIRTKKAKMKTLQGDLSDPYARIKDDCNFPRKVLDFVVALDEMEEAKRDHFLLALRLGLDVRKIFMPDDLVTRAEGTDGKDIVPSAPREKPKLATVAGKPAAGTGAAAIAAMKAPGETSDDEFEEATEEELAKQEGRGAASKTDAE